MKIADYKKIIDISHIIDKDTACFPGDIRFSHEIRVSFADSNVINLTSFTMSPHLGTHADSPVHIKGSLETSTQDHATDTTAGDMPLEPFIGSCVVLDLTSDLPNPGAITREMIEEKATRAKNEGIKRILFRTEQIVEREKFKDDYSYIGQDAATLLGQLGFVLVGLDTPSVDHIRAKDLMTHKILDQYALSWLENLDLTNAKPDTTYYLFAPPLKFSQLEASPVRAVLLEF